MSMKLMMKLMYRDDEATAVDAAAVQYQFELLFLSIVDEADRESGLELGSRVFFSSPWASGIFYFLIVDQKQLQHVLGCGRQTIKIPPAVALFF